MMGKEERERGKKGRNKEMRGLRWNGFEKRNSIPLYMYIKGMNRITNIRR